MLPKSSLSDSNQRPADYKSAALPTVLREHIAELTLDVASAVKLLLEMEPVGVEPTTSSVQARRSPIRAMTP